MLLVIGDLDQHTSPRLRAAMDELTLATGHGVVIDLSALTFCDSTGISILVASYQRAREAGAKLALAGLDAEMTHVFKIMGLDRVLLIYETTANAIDALR
ncbi:STAS domain-containing protein [Streptosporangiaceae bacterium NEAU-GS5]|nr:STAS domain-containing protein [Streptosporangiaceae bacterium NEAU-GS5]